LARKRHLRISKSKFVDGVQCLKRLYLQVHQPELGDALSEASKAVIEQGRQVGLVAQRAFPGGVCVEAGPDQMDKALKLTKDLVFKFDAPAIFEATFHYNNVLVRTDILKRGGRFGHHLIEVKSATEAKPHYMYDLGIQRHVLTGAGVGIEKASLMHLNRDYVFDGKGYDVAKLFVVVEPTREDVVSDTEIADRVKEQFRILNQTKPPDIKPGRQCEDPEVCEFYDHCNPELALDHVSLIPRIGAKKTQELEAAGISSVKKIPAEFPLSETQRRAVESVKSGKLSSSSKLADELGALKYPLCFMDFETIFPALPRLAKMAPYDHIPFQWSVHRQEKAGGPIRHSEYLAEDSSDPRKPFIESLLKAVEGAGHVVVYNQSFEYSRLDDLARWLPQYASDIEKIKTSMWDMLVVMRGHVYHPKFGGSFSLKAVLPALVPEMNYKDLEVAEGTAAGLAWARFVDEATPAEEKARLKKALLKYCEQDTLAMVRLLEVLRKSV